MSSSCSCNNYSVSSSSSYTMSMETYIKQQQQIEDQVDYEFIQRIIQELTQSCALPLPISASAIPPLILQAAQYFWQNSDQAIEERWYCLPNHEFTRQGVNRVVKLPARIISVNGVYKLNDSFAYGILGDFSIERMILNNTAMAGGTGTTLSDVFGHGTGYNLTDMTAALYEIQTFKAMFDVPLTYDYNEFSNNLVILGSLRRSNLMLDVFVRLKIQDLYKDYYFFKYVVGLALRSMTTVLGTFEFKLPGGITINYSNFKEMGDAYIEEVKEYIKENRSPSYFLNTNTI